MKIFFVIATLLALALITTGYKIGTHLRQAPVTSVVLPAPEDCEQWYILGKPPVPFSFTQRTHSLESKLSTMTAEAAVHAAYSMHYLACRERNRRP